MNHPKTDFKGKFFSRKLKLGRILFEAEVIDDREIVDRKVAGRSSFEQQRKIRPKVFQFVSRSVNEHQPNLFEARARKGRMF